jgi:uncharacterized protein YdaU (DUF1376 family)
MTDLPEPLTPADCDCTDLDGFMLNVERLMASELVALSSHEVIGAAVLLWCRAWKQTPAASLPDDDRINAAFAKLALPRFRKLKAEVMRGFVKCSDGRLYHRTLAAEAVKAFDRKQAFRKKRETDAERLRKWRKGEGETRCETGDETRGETPGETQSETRFVAEGQGQGQGQVRDRDKDNPPPPEPEAARIASAVVWKNERMPLILAKVEHLDPTSAGIQNFAPLRKLEAEGLDFDQDILPALIAVGASWSNPKRLIHSWGLPSFADMAHANHERRKRASSAVDAAEWKRRLANWKLDRTWHHSWGPKPDEAGYKGPKVEDAA